MAIPSSGEIKISEIATEFGDTAPNQMSEYYRGGGLVPNTPANAAVPTSGQISVANFYGAQNRASVPLTISANTQNYDVYTQASASPSYVAGSTDITLTIQPGIYVGSSSTGTYALSVPNGFNPADTVTIVNNGIVIGRGGNGGTGGSSPTPAPAGAGSPGAGGGNAVYVNFPTTITNNGTLAGGGGGGGGGRAGQVVNPPTNPKQPSGPASNYGAGGGGGGAGYPGGSGGSGGSPGGGSGSSGSGTAGGGGGAGPGPAGNGGAGGGRGANGSTGQPSPLGGGAGGGTRGYYLVGNPLVTFPATGTLQGRVS